MLNKLSVSVLLIFCAFLFFWRLDKVPPGFYIDESLHSYNALSILETGKDEYGKGFPVLFRFFGSYNEPLYVYLTTISIWLFGETIFAARLISALAGVLSTILIYFFMLKVTKNRTTSVIVGLLGAMSPWLLLYSRTGFEVSLAFFLFLLGLFTFYLGTKKPKYIAISFWLFSFSTYAAYTERFVSPLLALLLIFIFKEYLFRKENRKYLLLGTSGALLIEIPHLFLVSTPAFFPKGDLFSLGGFIARYIYYFSPEALFFKGDPDLQRSVPEMAVFPFWLVIPYFVGWYFCFKKRFSNLSKLIIASALISPLPAALTSDPFATHRAMPLLAQLLLVIGIGVNKIFEILKPFLGVFLFLLIFMVSALLLWRSFFVLLPGERSFYWGQQYVELAKLIKQDHQNLYLIDQGRLKIAYATIAYIADIDPLILQQPQSLEIEENYYSAFPYNPSYSFPNVELRSLNWETDIYKNQIIVCDNISISQEQAREHFLKKEFEITDPLGEVLLSGFKTSPKSKCESIKYENTHCKGVK